MEKRFQEEDLNDCFLVDTTISSGSFSIKVFVDSDSTLPLSKCQTISRYLESHLEEESLVPENYKLEVSSPGTSRPLKFERQYKKNIGRTLEVHTHSNETHKGILRSVLNEKITIEIELSKKQAKKLNKKTEEIDIMLKEIEKSIVKISFKKS